jgi:hypothetical protein
MSPDETPSFIRFKFSTLNCGPRTTIQHFNSHCRGCSGTELWSTFYDFTKSYKLEQRPPRGSRQARGASSWACQAHRERRHTILLNTNTCSIDAPQAHLRGLERADMPGRSFRLAELETWNSQTLCQCTRPKRIQLAQLVRGSTLSPVLWHASQ